ncbi:flagellar brake domain-containing protein [Nitrosomonas supralitoralis]|uniref:Flagellar brake protein n=1 Tax=Nitrosomonas supralitoralis TaxID=2116706 RepID=A0A2P7NS04_9PROT|nr:flagellar brake protein [Nitrosomonas supralitoralis]PSJ16237.1 flagellar brake protein [Nitrosomonas supralitoralis]
MNLIPVQAAEITIGRPLPWDLFDQAHQQIQQRGYVFKTMDEVKQLEETPIFRIQKPELKRTESANDSTEKIRFEDMHLKVGHKMYLTLAAYAQKHGDSSNSFATSMIGYVPDSTLIVTMPASGQLAGAPFVEGDQINVRLIAGQNAYKFSAYVDKIIKVPFKFLHLSFPQNIQGQSFRKSRRIKCNYQATISEESIPINIMDLSIYGAGINSTLPLGTPGSVVTLSFTISVDDKEIPLSIKAIIKPAKKNNRKDQKIISLGLEFTEMKPDQVFALRHLIYQEIVEHPENEI